MACHRRLVIGSVTVTPLVIKTQLPFLGNVVKYTCTYMFLIPQQLLTDSAYINVGKFDQILKIFVKTSPFLMFA